MAWITEPSAWVAFLTLTALEIVLGIDNIIFISILVAKLPQAQRGFARRLGLTLAMVMRILLLLAISWIMGLTTPLFGLLGKEFSGRDLILLIGGLFLLVKSVHEIHEKLEGAHGAKSDRIGASFTAVIVQIALLDIVFSLDSVITAVGMTQTVGVMIAAVVVAVAVMMVLARPIGDFVHKHPTLKILALSFLLLIGVLLIAEGFGYHVTRGYVYFSMAFALGVEILNLRISRKEAPPVSLRDRYAAAKDS